MRLRRLDLIRYGKFTDRTIDFGPRPVSGPDLHIVFGLNEAGKSTALSGYLDLLFGIEERSRYNFLHEYATMRVGGVLEMANEEHAFTRTKQRSNSLLNAAGQPVSEMAIAGHLAGLSREAYGTMFSLDDETLEDGGRAILESQGDLGRLLFTASAGLGHASDTLAALEAEANDLYRKQAQVTALARLKKQLADLKAKRDEIDTAASTYEALDSERRDAADRYDRSLAERAGLVARREVIARHLRAIPILAEIGRKTAQLAQLSALPAPALPWSGSVTQMIDDDARLRTQLLASDHELTRIATRIAAVTVDELALSVSERIGGLSDRKAKYTSAGVDLPNRVTEVKILDNTVASILASLGRRSEVDPAALLLPAATIGAVRTMVEQRSGIETAARVARDEAAAADEALQSARARVGQERSASRPVRARLAAALSRARDSGHVREMRAAQDAEDSSQILWEAAVLRLHPWTGDAPALARLPVPSLGQVSTWKSRASEIATSRAVLTLRLAEQQADHQRLSGRLDTLRAAATVTDDATTTAVRLARDTAWREHREELAASTADAFARLMSRDDEIAGNRLANARELAEIRTAGAAVAELGSAIAQLEAQLGHSVATLNALTSDIRRAVGPLLAIGDDTGPERLIEMVESFTAARSDALAAWAGIEAARRKLARADAELAGMRVELDTALRSVGLPADPQDTLEAAVAAAEAFLERQTRIDAELTEALRTVATREEDVTARRRALAMAEQREEDWLVEIARALKGTWLEGGLSASGASFVLDRLAELAKGLADRDAMRLRIEKMAADRVGFLTEVNAVAAQAGWPPDSDEPEQLASRLAERLDSAQRSRDVLSALEADRQRLEDERQRLDAEIASHGVSKTEVLSAFGVAGLPEVLEREESLRERDRLRAAIAGLEEQLMAELALETPAAAREALIDVDSDGLAAERSAVERRLADLEETLGQQLVRQTRAADRLEAIGGDSAVARIDTERRTVLLDMAEKATRYIELRIGVMAASDALRVYRERHRSGMMTRASDAFAMMTRGQYSTLSTQPSKSGEVLIAMQRDGQSKVADALSKGARFQLYLALRLAGYYEYARFRPAVPFIADDIMETFDHVRSEEVFKLFAEMATVGQVIYLTHHRHLCDIAKAVVPAVVIHELA